MDSMISSRYSHDIEEIHPEHNDENAMTVDSVISNDDEDSSWEDGRRSYDRYDSIDQEFYANDNEADECSNSLEEHLRANNRDFFRLELDDPIEGVTSLVQAIQANQTVREVEVHIEALEGLSRQDQNGLADVICALPELRSLLVYKNSSSFLEPLARHRPFLLRHLRLCKLDINECKTAVGLVSALEGLPSIKSLDIGFEANDSNQVLEALSLTKSIFVTLESFRVDYKLLTQTVEGNILDDRIVAVIAQAVRSSETLKSLSLPPFGCSDHCHDTLIQMLHQNCVLERIDYWARVCNLYYPDANETIDHLLHLNRSGVRRLVKVKQGNISSAEVLQQVSHDDLESIYHLFSSDPSLCCCLQEIL